MEMRQLGHSGLHVSAIGFGAMTFGADGVLQAIGQTLEKEAERQVGLCLDAGVTLFDTAEGYSAGRSEEILAHALGKRRHEAIIATKAWNGTGTGPNAIGASRLHILQACDESLRRLRTDYIDLYQIHCWDALVPLEETVRALDDLVRAGKVRYIGCSNYAGWQLTKALGLSDRHGLARFVSNQIYYSLAGRDAEHEIVPAALDQGVGLLLWGPLAFGLLTGKFRRGQPDPEGARGSLMGAPGGGIERARLDDLTDAIADIAAARGVTASQIAINYLRRKPAVSCVMFGARNEAQLRDNLAAAQWSLSDEEFTRLDTLSVPRPYAPAWIQRYIFGSRNP